MNCPSRPEPEGPGFNQNPNSLAADLTTRQDLNGIANSRILRRMAENERESVNVVEDDQYGANREKEQAVRAPELMVRSHVGTTTRATSDGSRDSDSSGDGSSDTNISAKGFIKLPKVVVTFAKFVGPGFMVGNSSDPASSIS